MFFQTLTPFLLLSYSSIFSIRLSVTCSLGSPTSVASCLCCLFLVWSSCSAFSCSWQFRGSVFLCIYVQWHMLLWYYAWCDQLQVKFHFMFLEFLSSTMAIIIRCSYPLFNIWGCIFFSLPNTLVMVERIYLFVLLSSSNRKYELLSIAQG